MKEVGNLRRFLEGTVQYKFHLTLRKSPIAPKGKCQIGRLHSTIQEINKDKDKDLHSCITTQVQNLHAVGHFKDEFPTVLNFACNLGNSVYETIKMITTWAAYYSPHPIPYYPVPETTIALKKFQTSPSR